MTDKEKLAFKEKYENNPVAFCEDFLKVKLLPYQKLLLEAMNQKDKFVNFINSFRHGKKILWDIHIEYMKAMGMSFEVWKPEGIDVYENGELVKILKHKKGK